MSSIQFLGSIVSDNGIQSDSNKVKAIAEMPAPSNKLQARRLIGVMDCIGKFRKK